jgi:hypothetical protein
LSEQAFGSVGLLNALGLINDQMIALNVVVVAGSLAGIAVAVLAFDPSRLSRPITLSMALIAIACFLDAGATNLTRPANLYLSQAMIGFASLLFLAQAQVIGSARTMLAGGERFISFVVLFGLSQNIGGLLGSALLGTLQTVREKFHAHEIGQRIVATDPLVAERLAAGGHPIGSVVGDPGLRTAESAATLGQAVTREANVLAFNDVFLVLGVLTVVAICWQLWVQFSIRRRHEVSPVIALQRRAARPTTQGDQ